MSLQAIELVQVFMSSPKFEDMSIMPGAHDALLTLKAKYSLVLVTSRQHAIEALTERWLERHYAGWCVGCRTSATEQPPRPPMPCRNI